MVTFKTYAFFLFNLFALYPYIRIFLEQSFLSDVVSSFHFFLGTVTPRVQCCVCPPFFSQLPLLAASLVVPEAQIHFGLGSLGGK